MTIKKSKENSAFFKLDKKHQEAVKLLFEGDLKDEEIAKKINRSTVTLWKWKKDPLFKEAQHEYSISQLNNALPDAIKELLKLIRNGRSEMVKLQAIQTVLKQAGLFADNGTPELDAARIRKANADARVAEARAKAMEDNGQDMEQLLDKMLDTLTKEDLKHGSK